MSQNPVACPFDTAISGATMPCQQDTVINTLRAILGEDYVNAFLIKGQSPATVNAGVANADLTTLAVTLGTLSNLAITAAILILVVSIYKWVTNSSADGEAVGISDRGALLGMFGRPLFALTLLAPTASGFPVINIIIMSVVLWANGATNSLYATIADRYIKPPSMDVSHGNTDVFKAASDVTDSYLLGSMQGYCLLRMTQSGAEPQVKGKSDPEKGGYTLSYRDNRGKLTNKKADLCGSFTVERFTAADFLPQPSNKMSNANTSDGQVFRDILAIQKVQSEPMAALMQARSGYAAYAYLKGMRTAMGKDAYDQVMKVRFNYKQSVAGNSVVVPVSITSASTDPVNMSKFLLGRSTSPITDNQPSMLALPAAPWDTDPDAEVILRPIDTKAIMDDAVVVNKKLYEESMDILRKAAVNATNNKDLIDSSINSIRNSLFSKGWMNAGNAQAKLRQMTTGAAQKIGHRPYKVNYSIGIPASDIAEEAETAKVVGNINYVTAAMGKTIKDELPDTHPAQVTLAAEIAGSTIAEGGDNLALIDNFSISLTGGLHNMNEALISTIVNVDKSQQDTLSRIQNFGEWMLVAIGAILIGMILLRIKLAGVATAAEAAAGASLGTLSGLAAAAKNFNDLVDSILLAPLKELVDSFFLISRIFGVVIPSMPYIFLILAGVGWFIQIIQTMFGMPLWLIMHSIPEKSFIGSQQQGYVTLLSLLFRPILIISGFFVAFDLYDPLVVFATTAFFDSYGTISGATSSNSASQFMIYLASLKYWYYLYAGVLMGITYLVFGLVQELSDSVLDWLGTNLLRGFGNMDSKSTMQGVAGAMSASAAKQSQQVAKRVGEKKLQGGGGGGGESGSGGKDGTKNITGGGTGDQGTGNNPVINNSHDTEGAVNSADHAPSEVTVDSKPRAGDGVDANEMVRTGTLAALSASEKADGVDAVNPSGSSILDNSSQDYGGYDSAEQQAAADLAAEEDVNQAATDQQAADDQQTADDQQATDDVTQANAAADLQSLDDQQAIADQQAADADVNQANAADQEAADQQAADQQAADQEAADQQAADSLDNEQSVTETPASDSDAADAGMNIDRDDAMRASLMDSDANVGGTSVPVTGDVADKASSAAAAAGLAMGGAILANKAFNNAAEGQKFSVKGKGDNKGMSLSGEKTANGYKGDVTTTDADGNSKVVSSERVSVSPNGDVTATSVPTDGSLPVTSSLTRADGTVTNTQTPQNSEMPTTTATFAADGSALSDTAVQTNGGITTSTANDYEANTSSYLATDGDSSLAIDTDNNTGTVTTTASDSATTASETFDNTGNLLQTTEFDANTGASATVNYATDQDGSAVPMESQLTDNTSQTSNEFDAGSNSVVSTTVPLDANGAPTGSPEVTNHSNSHITPTGQVAPNGGDITGTQENMVQGMGITTGNSKVDGVAAALLVGLTALGGGDTDVSGTAGPKPKSKPSNTGPIQPPAASNAVQRHQAAKNLSPINSQQTDQQANVGQSDANKNPATTPPNAKTKAINLGGGMSTVIPADGAGGALSRSTNFNSQANQNLNTNNNALNTSDASITQTNPSTSTGTPVVGNDQANQNLNTNNQTNPISSTGTPVVGNDRANQNLNTNNNALNTSDASITQTNPSTSTGTPVVGNDRANQNLNVNQNLNANQNLNTNNNNVPNTPDTSITQTIPSTSTGTPVVGNDQANQNLNTNNNVQQMRNSMFVPIVPPTIDSSTGDRSITSTSSLQSSGNPTNQSTDSNLRQDRTPREQARATANTRLDTPPVINSNAVVNNTSSGVKTQAHQRVETKIASPTLQRTPVQAKSLSSQLASNKAKLNNAKDATQKTTATKAKDLNAGYKNITPQSSSVTTADALRPAQNTADVVIQPTTSNLRRSATNTKEQNDEEEEKSVTDNRQITAPTDGAPPPQQ